MNNIRCDDQDDNMMKMMGKGLKELMINCFMLLDSYGFFFFLCVLIFRIFFCLFQSVNFWYKWAVDLMFFSVVFESHFNWLVHILHFSVYFIPSSSSCWSMQNFFVHLEDELETFQRLLVRATFEQDN